MSIVRCLGVRGPAGNLRAVKKKHNLFQKVKSERLWEHFIPGPQVVARHKEFINPSVHQQLVLHRK